MLPFKRGRLAPYVPASPLEPVTWRSSAAAPGWNLEHTSKANDIFIRALAAYIRAGVPIQDVFRLIRTPDLQNLPGTRGKSPERSGVD